MQSLHAKPTVKHGHFVLFLPVTSTQETVLHYNDFFLLLRTGIASISSFGFLVNIGTGATLAQVTIAGLALLTQGQRDFPPLLIHATLFRDFALLPQLHPVSLAGWHSGSCSSLDSSLLRAPRPHKSNVKYR